MAGPGPTTYPGRSSRARWIFRSVSPPPSGEATATPTVVRAPPVHPDRGSTIGGRRCVALPPIPPPRGGTVAAPAPTRAAGRPTPTRTVSTGQHRPARLRRPISPGRTGAATARGRRHGGATGARGHHPPVPALPGKTPPSRAPAVPGGPAGRWPSRGVTSLTRRGSAAAPRDAPAPSLPCVTRAADTDVPHRLRQPCRSVLGPQWHPRASTVMPRLMAQRVPHRGRKH